MVWHFVDRAVPGSSWRRWYERGESEKEREREDEKEGGSAAAATREVL